MAIRLRIALVVGLVLFMLMEDVNSMLAKRCYGDCKYRRLEARVKKLEDALCELDLDCKLCSMIKNLTALVEQITDKVPPKGNCTAIGVAADKNNVSDSQMTASSVYLHYYAYKGRLNGPLGWCQRYQHITYSDYLQIDMKRLRHVCAVSTQGKKNGSWVTSYKLKFSTNGVTFTTYQENNTDKIFAANSDLNTIVHHSLKHDVQARYVRFYPVTRYNFPCMRVEVFAR